MSQGQTILIIDDNEQNRKLERDLLEVAGFQVVDESDPLAGIERARSLIPDIIIMDIQMPKMDGIQVSRILGEDPLTSDIPCIAVSAYATHAERERIEQQGRFAGYFTKPIDTRTFAEEIKRVASGEAVQ